MCTLTWAFLENGKGYHIHFNRDESRLRSKAELPALLTERGVQFLAPIDTEALGTWILSNEHGFSACLLNNYIEIKGGAGQRSRGLLVRDLCCAQSVDEAYNRFDNINMADYSPFDIYLFDKNSAIEISWNGESRSDNKQPPVFKSSSGFNTAKVIRGREEQFASVDKTPEQLRNFHASHQPEKSAYSVCMHREDACTQSYTEIRVDEAQTSMRYSDGPPCQSELLPPISLDLI